MSESPWASGSQPLDDDDEVCFTRLLHRFLDDELTETEAADFATHLESRTEYRQLLVDMSLQRTAFVRLLGQTQKISRVRAGIANFLPTQCLSLAPRWSAAAPTLCIGLVFYGTFLALAWNVRREPETAGQYRNTAASAGAIAPEIVATLTEGSDCRWDRTSGTIVSNQLASRTVYCLQSGRAVLTFAGGATAAVEGPAKFQLNSAGSARLHRGTLAVHVPQQAIGFEVETATARVVDLGTDFVVEVPRDGETRLAVTSGTVNLFPVGTASDGGSQLANKPRRVEAGQAFVIAANNAGKAVVQETKFDANLLTKLAPVSSPSRLAAPSVAYQLRENLPGNQRDFHGGVGLDFEVCAPIRVFSLGVFDHQCDGIDPATSPVVQLWSRNTINTLNETSDDLGGELLASEMFTAGDSGELKQGHRFKPLRRPIDLPVGSYSIVAYGLSDANPFIALEDLDHDVDFRSDPGWTGSKNTTNGNHFGWISSTNRAGGKTGEVGGTFARVQVASYFGDTRLSKTLSLGDAITASGRFDIQNISTGWSGDGDSGFFIGHFSTNATNKAFIGLEFKEDGAGRTNLIRLRARCHFWTSVGFSGGRSAETSVSTKGNHTFSYLYDPNQGQLTVKIDEQPTLVVELTDGEQKQGMVFDAFGMGFLSTFNSENDSTKTVEAYLDDVSYSGFRAAAPRSVKVIESRRPLAHVETWQNLIMPIGSRWDTVNPGAFPVMRGDRPRGCVAGSFEYGLKTEGSWQ